MEPDSTETGLTPTCRRNHGRDISGTHNGSVPGGWGGGRDKSGIPMGLRRGEIY